MAVAEPEPWRIGHLTTSDISLALLLATELHEAVEAGHTVVGISGPGPYVERITGLGVRHLSVPNLTRSWDVRRDVRAFRELLSTLRTLDLDVLHTHNPKTGVMGRVAGRLAGVPVVVNTCHGLWATPEDTWRKRLLVYGLEGLATRFSDFEFFQNEQDEHTLRWFLRSGRHLVVGNGIDLERFRFDPAGRDRLRAEWGVGPGELVIGTVGRRVAEKGMAQFAAAAAELAGRARFVWVGPEDEVQRPVGMPASTVEFVAEQIDMPAVYSAFDVFVLASYREGFSRASMEAAACGRPLVLSDIRGCREIGSDGVHALLVPARDPTALTEAIAAMIRDAELRNRLATAAEARAREHFDQRRIARISRETYAGLLSRPQRLSARRRRKPQR